MLYGPHIHRSLPLSQDSHPMVLQLNTIKDPHLHYRGAMQDIQLFHHEGFPLSGIYPASEASSNVSN